MNKIETDVWHWLENYIEVKNEFYDYKFPPCPFAKAARLSGLVIVKSFKNKSVRNFINDQTTDLIEEKKYSVLIMVFPPRIAWSIGLKHYIKKLNQTLIPQDFYAQYGTAINTSSQYTGFFNQGPYFIIIVNKLSDVLDGHMSLLKTDYYTPWDDFHYEEVVVRRQQAYEKNKVNK